jgi:hypothetical protein
MALIKACEYEIVGSLISKEKYKFTDKTLIADLNRLKVTFKDLAKKGYFTSPAELKKSIEMIDSIIKMLSMTVGNNSIGLF